MAITKKPAVQKKRRKSKALPGKSGDIYRDIFDTSGAALAVISEDGTFVLVNANFEEMSGYTKAEIEGMKSWNELALPDHIGKLASYTASTIEDKMHLPQVIAFDLINSTGRCVPVLLSLRHLPGTRQAVATITEGSVQRRFEEMLRAIENRYRTLVSIVPVGVFRTKIDSPGKLLWGNPALVRMYGFESLAAMLKDPITAHYAETGDRDRFIAEIAETGVVRDITSLQRRRDGSCFWARITARAVKNREGSVGMIEGIVEDITDELAVRDTAEHHRHLASTAIREVTGFGICTTGPDGVLTLVNRGLLDMLGYSSDELIGRSTPLIFHSGPELEARGGRALTRVRPPG